MKKLAVVFPGNGYHNDRPLLHHATNLMKGFGFEVIDVEYGLFPKDSNMDGACELVKQYAQEYLCQVHWEDYDQIVFIAKSLGTVAAGYIAAQLAYPIGCLMLTPLPQTLPYLKKEQQMVFYALNDPYCDAALIKSYCQTHQIESFCFTNEYSIEPTDTLECTYILLEIVNRYRVYMKNHTNLQLQMS